MSELRGVLRGKQVTDLMLDIYLDGFTTGAASAIKTVGQLGDDQDDLVDSLADDLCEALRRDPLGMDALMRAITERFTGQDSGPKSFTIPAAALDPEPTP